MRKFLLLCCLFFSIALAPSVRADPLDCCKPSEWFDSKSPLLPEVICPPTNDPAQEACYRAQYEAYWNARLDAYVKFLLAVEDACPPPYPCPEGELPCDCLASVWSSGSWGNQLLLIDNGYVYYLSLCGQTTAVTCCDPFVWIMSKEPPRINLPDTINTPAINACQQQCYADYLLAYALVTEAFLQAAKEDCDVYGANPCLSPYVPCVCLQNLYTVTGGGGFDVIYAQKWQDYLDCYDACLRAIYPP